MDDIKREELEKACKKIRRARARMAAVRMVLVLDTADTTPAQYAAEGCKPTQVCPDCVAFLGSAVPERPSCIVLEAASTGLDRLPDDKPNGFATWTARCPKKSFLPGAAGKASFRCGPARVTVSCGRETCVRIKTFRLGANIQKIQVASERIFMTPTSHNRFMGSDPNKLAVLIDGDNAYLEYIERVMAYTSRHGQVVARRIYGAHDKLDSHLECIKCHGFKPTYAEGQNAADTAMIMDATEMFHSKVADGYCIVTSDNDFAELASFGSSKKTAYYLHRDGIGKEYLYKIGSDKRGGCMPRKMVERMHRYLNDVEMDITDDAVLEEAKKVMLVALGSQAIAERVTGTRVMSRKEMLCDFARLDRDEGIEIHDRGLEQDHFPRLTHRGFGVYPAEEGMLLHDMEEELYWGRLKKGEPIPPEVWKLLEDACLEFLEKNLFWLGRTRKRLGWVTPRTTCNDAR